MTRSHYHGRGGTVGSVRLDTDEARRRFATQSVARLATVRVGAPRIVPIVFAVDGDRIVTAVDHKPKSTRALRRLEDIAQTPAVSVLADHYEDDWTRLWWVRADGTAIVRGDEHAVDLLVAKYPAYSQQRPAGPVIVIDVERWSGWAAS
jgi:PPOX class probable F420-dependent enzyme